MYSAGLKQAGNLDLVLQRLSNKIQPDIPLYAWGVNLGSCITPLLGDWQPNKGFDTLSCHPLLFQAFGGLETLADQSSEPESSSDKEVSKFSF
jgi:hypothetical protein